MGTGTGRMGKEIVEFLFISGPSLCLQRILLGQPICKIKDLDWMACDVPL